MNKYKADYNTLIDLYSNKGINSFDDLPFDYKKNLALDYMKSLSWNEQQEVAEYVSEVINPKLLDMILEILINHDERIDAASEMADEFVKALFAVVTDHISADIEEFQDKQSIQKIDNLRAQDIAERTRDLKASFPIQLNW